MFLNFEIYLLEIVSLLFQATVYIFSFKKCIED